MKRWALIVAAVLVVVGGAVGATFYFKPAVLFSRAEGTDAPAAHGAPMYSKDASEETEARRHALRLVEQLGAVQDKIIRGDRGALMDQQRLLSDIASELRSFGEEQWSDYVNVRTSLLYVLSGGNANVLKPLIDQKMLGIADELLATGIMSFAEGDTKKARELLQDIDPRSLDVSLVGPFALAKASLYLEDDHAKAIRLLDDARLACPHTAIDEASARREIPILFDSGDTRRAMMLTTAYVREFGQSIYARKFFRDFSEAAAKHDEFDNDEIVKKLAASFDNQPTPPAAELFVDLAGEALLLGKLKLAKAAAAKAAGTSGIPSELADKARLYSAAAEAPSADAGNALKALDQITADRLSSDDSEIREVAGFIAKTVVGTNVASSDSQAPALAGGRRKKTENPPPAPSAIKAEAALNKVDGILKKADSMISGSEK